MQLVAHAVLITFSGCLNGFRPLRWARILTLRRFCYFLGNLKCFSTIKTTTCVGLATYCTRVLITFSTCLNCFRPLRRTSKRRVCNLLHTRFNHIFNLPELLSSVTEDKNAHPTAFLLLFRLPERLNAMPLQRLQRCVLLLRQNWIATP